MKYQILTSRKSKNTAAEAMWDVWFDYLFKHYNLNIYRDRVMIQINNSHFESTLEDQIKRVWYFPYSDCDLVKFEDGSIGFVFSIIGKDDIYSFKFSPIQKYSTWEDKLIQIKKLLKEVIDEIGLEYDTDNDEYKTKINTGIDRDTLSEIDGLYFDLTFYYEN